MTRNRTVQGTVTKTDGNPRPHSFWIRGEDGNEYFAHLGDLSHNSLKLLRNEDTDTQFLKEGDNVTFSVWEDNIKKVFNVVKLDSK